MSTKGQLISQAMDHTLETFALATHWKSYWAGKIKNYLKGDMVEVGCGRGDNLPYLNIRSIKSYTGLEIDNHLLIQATSRFQEQGQFICGHWPQVDGKQFDTIIYLDVLEHIENDQEELRTALSYLRPGGHLIILVPAHQFLFTPFDKKIGHFRRYNRPMLKTAIPRGLNQVFLHYLDSIGLFASLANKLLLKTADPTMTQVQIWDRYMVPLSQFSDRLCFHMFGKSLIGVWQKSDALP